VSLPGRRLTRNKRRFMIACNDDLTALYFSAPASRSISRCMYEQKIRLRVGLLGVIAGGAAPVETELARSSKAGGKQRGDSAGGLVEHCCRTSPCRCVFWHAQLHLPLRPANFANRLAFRNIRKQFGQRNSFASIDCPRPTRIPCLAAFALLT